MYPDMRGHLTVCIPLRPQPRSQRAFVDECGWFDSRCLGGAIQKLLFMSGQDGEIGCLVGQI